jgi:hypothetical protein
VRDGLVLHGGVHDQTFELGGFDRLHLHGRVDGGLEQLLQPFFAHGTTKATDLRGVAGQARFVVTHAAEELPHHVLGPTCDEFFVAEVEGVLQVLQADHQTDGQTVSACFAQSRTEFNFVRAQQIQRGALQARADTCVRSAAPGRVRWASQGSLLLSTASGCLGSTMPSRRERKNRGSQSSNTPRINYPNNRI